MLVKSYVRKFNGSKGMLQIPSEMCSVFGKELVVTATRGHGLSLHTLSHFEKVEKKVQRLSNLLPNERTLKRLILGYATDIAPDKRNRILLSPDLSEYAELMGETAILCVGNSARLVPRYKWNQLHTNPNSEESRALLNNLSLPLFSDRSDSPNESIEEMKEVLEGKYKLLKESQESRDFREFELLIGEIFNCHKVGIVEVTQYANDEGIDLLVYVESDSKIDILFVQLKAGNSTATVSDLRELIGSISLKNGKAGLLVSASGFTSGARKASSQSQGTRIKTDITDALKLSYWIERQLSVII